MKRNTKIVFAVAIGICALVSFGVRELVSLRSQTAYSSCISLLRQIDGAKATWALDNKKKNEDTPTWGDLVGPDRYIRKMLVCPKGGTYSIGKVAEHPRCSYGGPDHSLTDLELPSSEKPRTTSE
jgi:hypothetical protein